MLVQWRLQRWLVRRTTIGIGSRPTIRIGDSDPSSSHPGQSAKARNGRITLTPRLRSRHRCAFALQDPSALTSGEKFDKQVYSAPSGPGTLRIRLTEFTFQMHSGILFFSESNRILSPNRRGRWRNRAIVMWGYDPALSLRGTRRENAARKRDCNCCSSTFDRQPIHSTLGRWKAGKLPMLLKVRIGSSVNEAMSSFATSSKVAISDEGT